VTGLSRQIQEGPALLFARLASRSKAHEDIYGAGALQPQQNIPLARSIQYGEPLQLHHRSNSRCGGGIALQALNAISEPEPMRSKTRLTKTTRKAAA